MSSQMVLASKRGSWKVLAPIFMGDTSTVDTCTVHGTSERYRLFVTRTSIRRLIHITNSVVISSFGRQFLAQVLATFVQDQ